jgi:large subunit ribosomal protein L20
MWIQRINASSRMYGMPYATFIHSLNRSNIILNRKVLSDLAVSEPLSFKSVIAVAREAQATA